MQRATTLLAQDAPTSVELTPGGSGAENFGALTALTLPAIISFAITATLVLAGVIFFFMLIIGGVRWILSGGDKAKTEGARNQITAALIGLVIVFSAWAITLLLGSVFGIGNITNLDFGTIQDSGSTLGG